LLVSYLAVQFHGRDVHNFECLEGHFSYTIHAATSLTVTK
jgi:hypothetical protein